MSVCMYACMYVCMTTHIDVHNMYYRIQGAVNANSETRINWLPEASFR